MSLEKNLELPYSRGFGTISQSVKSCSTSRNRRISTNYLVTDIMHKSPNKISYILNNFNFPTRLVIFRSY